MILKDAFLQHTPHNDLKIYQTIPYLFALYNIVLIFFSSLQKSVELGCSNIGDLMLTGAHLLLLTAKHFEFPLQVYLLENNRPVKLDWIFKK